MSRSIMRTPVSLILVVLMTAACAASVNARGVDDVPSNSVPGASVGTAERLLPTDAVHYVRVATTERWGDGEVIVVPPDPSDIPSVSTEDAVATCDSGSACGSIDALPAIRLGRATTTDAGTVGADGSLRAPIMEDTLVFEMIWTGEPCLPVGGTSIRAPGTTPNPESCTTIAWVDATTGEPLCGLSDVE